MDPKDPTAKAKKKRQQREIAIRKARTAKFIYSLSLAAYETLDALWPKMLRYRAFHPNIVA